jgi:hypothetical protein
MRVTHLNIILNVIESIFYNTEIFNDEITQPLPESKTDTWHYES